MAVGGLFGLCGSLFFFFLSGGPGETPDFRFFLQDFLYRVGNIIL